MKLQKNKSTLGRPRAFDPEEALEQAIQIFWQKGYEGTSLDDLTSAMGINRPSLYAAFGNKEALFRKALDRYCGKSIASAKEALNEPTARAVAEQLLFSTVENLSDTSKPRGCLIIQGALSCGDKTNSIREELIARRKAGLVQLSKRFERAKAEGDLPKGSHPTDLARYIFTIIYGMTIHAINGATRSELQRLVKIALQAWPD